MRAKLGLRVCGGLGTAKMSGGIITATVMGDIYLEAMRQLDGEAPDIYLADLRMPLWAMTAQQLGAWFDGADAAVCAPAALIVAPAAYDLFCAHAVDMAHRGIMRTVFTDPGRAAQWVQLRRKVMQHQDRSS